MANTFTQLRYHCIWSTKNREPMIRPDIEERIWAIIAETGSRHGINVVKVGGIENHVHALIDIPKTLSVSESMKGLKGGSSNGINKAGIINGHFSWQDGYGAFTLSASSVADVLGYITNQREHHRTMTFEEEYVKFLEKHGVEYDAKYLWD